MPRYCLFFFCLGMASFLGEEQTNLRLVAFQDDSRLVEGC